MNSIIQNMIITGVALFTAGTANLIAYPKTQNGLDDLKEYKRIQVSFDNNKLENEVNNREYTPLRNTYKIVDSIKGNGFNSKNDYFSIPFEDASILSKKDLTISFLFKWGGQNKILPLRTSELGVYILDGNIGINTGNGDNYGTPIPFKVGEIVHISLAVDIDNLRASDLYINGIKQSLKDCTSNKLPTTIKEGSGNQLYIGGYVGISITHLTMGLWLMKYMYIKGKLMIQRLKILHPNITYQFSDEN